MKKIFKNAIKLFVWDFPLLILFEIVHKTIGFFILFPILSLLLREVMASQNLSYLTVENFSQLLKTPFGIFSLLVAFMTLSYFLLVEITGIVFYFQSAMLLENMALMNLIKLSLKRSLRLLHPKNILLLLVIIIFIPLANFMVKPDLLASIKVPEFIIDFIRQNQWLDISYYFLIIGIELLLFRWMFSLHEITLSTISFKEARKESIALTKGRKWKLLKAITVWSVFIGIGSTLLYFISIPIIGLTAIINTDPSSYRVIFFDKCYEISMIIDFLRPSLIFVTSMALVTSLYLDAKDFSFSEITQPPKLRSLKKKVIYVLSAIVLIAFNLILNEKDDRFMGLSEFYPTTTIIAHRASSVTAPENTIAALNEAILSGAQMAEIDVQQTKDGELVIIHDSNFKRTTGVDQEVKDALYEEVKTYDAGSWFRWTYEGEPIPTLEAFIQAAKGKINLMIEIKGTENEEELTQKVHDLIVKYKVESECVIASMNYDILKLSKQINPKIKTVYISALTYGEIENLEDVDFYSLEASFLTKSLIEQVHDLGRQIYVWTVNREDNMKKVLNMGVDGIITDNPYILSYYVTAETKPYVTWVADWLYGPSLEENSPNN